ncbi:hypothetical protein NADFUDRAFT_43380 [Nadsonia fulvescens var. elongata DSM 6958]|uniref:Uncharacterized protein n=1 Tax=Nadsonia fulvescens var. elongata DSM 6958 TaxID=857566 RepID=A0A1E3PGD4_9ASCO|nr:hypothetical protein NADFUDRAFT_43380 [Nadsonia fulvescens var. elongata DSM 6958]
MDFAPIAQSFRQSAEALQRIINIFTSRKALRSYIYVVIALVANICLVILAVLLYLVIYQLYIPHESVVVPIHLDYSAVSDTVYAVTDIFDNSPLHYSKLPDFKPGVSYEVWLNLKVPLTQHNQEMGNFMQKITLIDDLESFREVNALTLPKIKKSLYQPSRWPLSHFDYYSLQPGIKFMELPAADSLKIKSRKDGEEEKIKTVNTPGKSKMILTSVKPGFIKHYSALLCTLKTIVYWPFYVLGFWDQSETVSSHMLSGWRLSPNYNANSKNFDSPANSLATKSYGAFNSEGRFSFNSAKWVITELDRVVDIYEAELEWRVQWEGVRYWMQRHKLLTAISAICFFWSVEFITTLTVAVGIALYFSEPEKEGHGTHDDYRFKVTPQRPQPIRRDSNLDGIEPDRRDRDGDDLDVDPDMVVFEQLFQEESDVEEESNEMEEDPDMVVFEQVFHEDSDHHCPVDDIDFNHGYIPMGRIDTSYKALIAHRSGLSHRGLSSHGKDRNDKREAVDGAWSSGLQRGREDSEWTKLATPEATPAPESDEEETETEIETTTDSSNEGVLSDDEFSKSWSSSYQSTDEFLHDELSAESSESMEEGGHDSQSNEPDQGGYAREAGLVESLLSTGEYENLTTTNPSDLGSGLMASGLTVTPDTTPLPVEEDK